MSADPTIPVIEDGQSLNRFSYVFNNPLSYTDPSGFTPEGEKEPVATPNPCTTKDCKDNDKKKRCLQDNDCWNGGWRSFYPEGGDSTFNGGTKAAASKGQATAADSAKGEPSQSDALTPGELLLQRIADKAALARNCSLIETGCAQAVERVYKAIEKRQALESFDKEIIEAAFFEFKAASLVLAIPLKRLAAKGVGAAARATTKGLVDLTEHRAAHILNRHRAGTGISGKTEFPAGWSDNDILHHVSDVATDPRSTMGVGKWNSPYAIGARDGVTIRVDFYPPNHPTYAGTISTAYPINVAPNP